MVTLTQKNGKKVLINPKYVSHMIELKDGRTDIFFIAASTMVNMKVTVLEHIDQIQSVILDYQE